MPKILRPYQADAVSNTMVQLKKSPEPCLIDASVSAGKTLIVAALMKAMEDNRRNSLCLSMSSELIEQNSDEYADYAHKCSVFCAGLGKKNWRLPAVFSTPQTLWAAIKKGHKISKKKFSLITIDECHNVNANDDKTTYMKIISHYQEINPGLRVVGLTGTPFRGKGTSILGDDKFFKHKTADISLKWLTENDFVVPIKYGNHEATDYDFSDCKLQSNGKFRASDLEKASEGKGRLTADIVNEVIRNSQDRGGVIIFGSTIAHCEEILASLPEGISAIITGKTPDKERADIVRKVKSGEIKYIVNLSVLTTGFNAPIIDHVVFMRPTESAVLWVQAAGRGVRQLEGKDHCLVSDYANNLDRLGDVDNPMITEMVKTRDLEVEKEVPCPECGELNTIFARRCVGFVGQVRCGFFFSFNECPKCETKNDATAKNCRCCDFELIDPNQKLTRKAAFRVGVEPVRVQLIGTEYTRHKKKGKVDTLRVDYMYERPDGNADTLSEWFSPGGEGYPLHLFKREFVAKHAPDLEGHSLDMVLASKHLIKSPKSLLINKQVGSKFFSIVLKEF
ncbi:P-loop containing nucleoside triphosphate hydrolase [Vibrio phage 1.124.O._10N.286.49.B1]|nr:P-loop containing nucleoside triphosphate hydrolase [Vibrio phage 1.124.O._10N.286.49.B1]